MAGDAIEKDIILPKSPPDSCTTISRISLSNCARRESQPDGRTHTQVKGHGGESDLRAASDTPPHPPGPATGCCFCRPSPQPENPPATHSVSARPSSTLLLASWALLKGSPLRTDLTAAASASQSCLPLLALN